MEPVARLQHPFEFTLIECRRESLHRTWNGNTYQSLAWRLYHNSIQGAAFLVDRHWTDLRPDMLYLVRPGTVYRTRVQQPAPVQFYCHFSVAPIRFTHRTGAFGIPLDDVSGRLVAEIESQLADTEVMASHHGLALCCSLCLYIVNQIPDDETRQHVDPRIRRAIDRIHDYYGTTLQAADLAARAHLTPQSFNRLFKEHTGFTPYQYVLKLRLERAASMLHQTDYSIDQVAEATGFHDRFHFSKVFKRARGRTPAQFRKSSSETRS